MSKPTVRVLALLELLQSHGQLSGSELARRLEVDGRTLRRYIVALEELGIPISAERGRHGGYRLVAGFKLPPLMFSAEETLAVSLGLLAVRSLGLGESELALESAQAKLSRVMPVALRRRLVALRETASLDLARARAGTSVAALATLAEAAQVRARVEFRYRDPQGAETLRQLDPYGLAYRNGCWYVSGFCHLRQALRSFRLDRLDAPRMLAERFERPADFDTLRHLRESFARMPRATCGNSDAGGEGAGGRGARRAPRSARRGRWRYAVARQHRRPGLVRPAPVRPAVRLRGQAAAGVARAVEAPGRACPA